MSNPLFLYKAPSLIWTLSDQLLFNNLSENVRIISLAGVSDLS